jgi:hypothetical protein
MVMKLTVAGAVYEVRDYSVSMETQGGARGQCLPRRIRMRLALGRDRNAGAGIMKLAANQQANEDKLEGSIDVYNGADGQPAGEAIQQVKFKTGYIESVTETGAMQDEQRGLDLSVVAREVTLDNESFVVRGRA